MVAVSDAVGRSVSFEEAGEALTTGFGKALGISLEPAALSAREQQHAAQLRAEKYATDGWNLTLPARR